MNTMTAGQAARLVDTFLDANADNKGDERKLLSILSLVNSFAWKKGIWPGMTAEFMVRVNLKTKEIITPHGYDTLLKVNLDTQPVNLRDQFFQFHQNGMGSIKECCTSNWSCDVIGLGERPVLIQPNESVTGVLEQCDCIRIAVSSDGNPANDSFETLIQGYHNPILQEPEKRIYTRKLVNSQERVRNACNCEPVTIESVNKEEVIDGVLYPINGCMVVFDDLCWGRIESITKPVTDVAVDYWAVTPLDKFVRIARLEPNETSTSYRRYRVPDKCCYTPCVHGLFKKSEPHRLTSMREPMIIGDPEAIISLAIGLDLLYFKRDPNAATPYLLRGMQSLEETVDQKEGGEVSPIEVSVDMLPDDYSLAYY